MNQVFWRSLLTCLLLLALPFKGFAAASMLTCGPTHQQLFGTVSDDGAFAASSWHQHGDGESHQHAATQAFKADSNPLEYSSASTPSAGQLPQLDAKLKCNSCAPCCLSVAVTDNAKLPVTAPASNAGFPVFAPAFPSAPFARLDRPPRTILA